jgi:hypothetical protein
MYLMTKDYPLHSLAEKNHRSDLSSEGALHYKENETADI